MPRRFPVAVLVPVLAGLLTLSCLTTKNFKDPAGPLYEGHEAAPAIEEGAAAATGAVRVVTFNIAFARHMDLALSVLRDNEALRAPDILLLEEMDSAGVERLARELRLNYLYFPSAIHPMSGREFGTAILSPWPLGEARKLVLPHPAFGTRVQRAVTSGVVRRGGLRIRVYAVHLPAPGAVSADERQEQVRIITADAATSRDPVIIGGDFNGRVVGSWFTSAGFSWVTDRLPATSSALGLGFHWSYDHVFTRGLKPVAGRPASGVVDPAGASDHRPVWVLLEPTGVQK